MQLYHKRRKQTEKGAALAMAIIVVAILAVVALTALTFSSTEARIAGSDLQRTQTFYATEAAMEKMSVANSAQLAVCADAMWKMP